MQSDYRKRAIELLENNEGYARTGCTLLDCAVGGGIGLGFPFGKILNFVGDKSSGKTFLANEIIAANYHTFKKNLKWNYDDAETGYTFDSTKMYGFDIMQEDTLFSNIVEELDANVFNFLKSVKHKGIYVVDSLDGLCNADTEEREIKRAAGIEKAKKEGKSFKDDGTYGMQTQKFLSQEFFRTKASKLNDKEALLIFVSQIRDKIDAKAFQKKWTRAGGKALDFYAHTVLILANITKIKKQDKTIGLVIKAKTDKSKTPRPYRECEFSLYFDYGIDDIGSNLDYLFNLRGDSGKLTKSQEQIPWDGGADKNLTNIKEFLKKHECYDHCKEIRKEIEGKNSISVDWFDEYISNQAPDTAKQDYESFFGKMYTRDELIEKASTDPDFKREIEIRTIMKWEEIEDAVKTNRPRKY